ncbi:hypothetical protein PIB30_051061 [Stylosanthes scabra]|uniref:Uncharacterized protein n=1 Tax=Stylosanthes scabra TaxID=79078 RepID=A0ABU6TI78_9FABA|nr:hypothetical protein [Stylosanthes scabra]
MELIAAMNAAVSEGGSESTGTLHTWKSLVVAENPPARENSKHPFSLAILSEELPKKFKYPTDMEPYDGSSDPKHHLDAFDNRMVLLNASDATKSRKSPCGTIWTASTLNALRLRDWNVKQPSWHWLKASERIPIPQKPYQEATQLWKRFRKYLMNTCNKKKDKRHHRGDRNAYYKYQKQNGHDTEDCCDLLEFVEKCLKKGKFREYTGRSGDRRDDRRTRQRADSPKKSTEGKNEPKDGVVRTEIKMISGGLPDEGNPPSRKATKRSKHSCLAVEVMPRALHDKPPPEITFFSEEIGRTTDTLNPPLVISMDVFDATIR